MENTRLEEIGRRLIEQQPIQDVLTRAWISPIHMKSNYARTKAKEVAAAASAGLISTLISRGEYSDRWRLTPLGLTLLWEKVDLFDND